MNGISQMMTNCVVKPFYQKNAGLLLFAMIIFFGAVGKLNGQDLLGYHFFLIRGMLGSVSFLSTVCFGWTLYSIFCIRYVLDKLIQPSYQFLSELSAVETKKLFRTLLLLQALLYLPVLGYIAVIMPVAIHLQQYASLLAILVVNTALCVSAAVIYEYTIHHPGEGKSIILQKLFYFINIPRSYIGIFIKYILHEQKVLFLVIKLCSGIVLIFLVKGQHHSPAEMKMPLALYSAVILSHGLLLHSWHALETQRLLFLRGFPYTLIRRGSQSAGICITMVLPETLLLISWIPNSIYWKDAVCYACSGLSLLLLLNNLLYISTISRTDFLKLVGSVFFVFLMAVLSGTVIWISAFFSLLAAAIFFLAYYRYEG